MKRLAWNALAASALALAAGCSSGGGGGGQAMYIASSNLGCTNGKGGVQVSCSEINTYLNKDLAIAFSEAVNFATVENASFQVVNVNTGLMPPHNFVMTANPNRVIFRPDLSFDPFGNPLFGFEPDQSYEIHVHGTAQGDNPPFITSTSGKENASRLMHTIITDRGISDPVPGAAAGTVFVGLWDPVSKQCLNKVLAQGLTAVPLDYGICIEFDDLMNLSTVVIPSTGQAPFIDVMVDPDGDPGNPSDQVELFGTFYYDVDLNQLKTIVNFEPATGLPSGGFLQAVKRKIVVKLGEDIQDLVGNKLSNPGPVWFEPEVIQFPPENLSEDFADDSNEDEQHSGGDMWAATKPAPLAGGMMGLGTGGGSGRLGDLLIGTGGVETFYTSPMRAEGFLEVKGNPNEGDTFTLDGQTFKICEDTAVCPGGIPIQLEPETFYTVDRMVTELNDQSWSLPVTFSYRLLDAGGPEYEIVIRADDPGPAGNDFTLDDVESLVMSLSGTTLDGGSDGMNFPGRQGLTNFDFQTTPGGTPPVITVEDGTFEFATVQLDAGGLLIIEGDNSARVFSRGMFTVANGALIDVSGETPGEYLSDALDGQRSGRGGPNGGDGGAGADRRDNSGSVGSAGLMSIPPAGNFHQGGVVNPGYNITGSNGQGVGRLGAVASGPGGKHYPELLPPTRINLQDLGGNLPTCESEQVGAPGGGGAYAADGGLGVGKVPLGLETDSLGRSNTPADTAGGDSTQAGIEPPSQPHNVRTLNPTKGYLRGGSGGGGAGMCLKQTQTDDASGQCTIDTDPHGTPAGDDEIIAYHTPNGCAGGGGGGAFQGHAGNFMSVAGRIDASGGAGGYASDFTSASSSPFSIASNPGGGGSGGAVLLQAFSMSVAPVAGRLSVMGGLGGQSASPLALSTGGEGGHGLVRLEQFGGGLDADLLYASIDPQIDPMGLGYSDVLSLGSVVLKRSLPRSFQGAQSCWMKPQGSYFALNFDEDDLSDPNPANHVYAWDMTLVMDLGVGPVEYSYRNPNDPGYPLAQSFQTFWGDLLNRDLGGGETGAPVIVRFQGAKAVKSITDFCDVILTGGEAHIQPTSLTPWVRHPSELNEFNPPPDMIRFVVVYDASHDGLMDVRGITDVGISVTPD